MNDLADQLISNVFQFRRECTMAPHNRYGYLKPMRVTIIEAAKALGVTSKHVSGIVNGHVRVTADMAIRLAAALGTDAQTWVNLQAHHDLWVASQKKPPNVKPLRQAA
jgi:antitoxin HigA-1